MELLARFELATSSLPSAAIASYGLEGNFQFEHIENT